MNLLVNKNLKFFLKSNFLYLNLFLTNYANFCFLIKFFSLNSPALNHSLILKQQKTVVNSFLIRKLFYFLIISSDNSKLHFSYSNLVIKKIINPTKFSILNYNFLLTQLKVVSSLFNSLLLKNYSFFVFNFDFLVKDFYSFSKMIFGVKNVLKYQFIFTYDLKKFRNFKWKSRFNLFVKKKRVKIVFLLDIYNSYFFVDYLKTLKIITVGLIPQTQSPSSLDFWLICNKRDYIVKYIFFSFIYSLYNLFLNKKVFEFFKLYNRQFCKLLPYFS